MENFKDNLGRDVDNLITKRVQALDTVIKAEKELANHGVKFGTLVNDGLPEIEVSKNYLPQFTYHLEEYEWEAEYHDGKILRQYDISGQHHYGQIDQANLKSIRYVSNFNGENDNEERRIILTLDWKYGTFKLHNMVMDPEHRARLLAARCEEPKRLILFKRIRFGQMMEIGDRCTPTPEVYFYKRYFLGYEVPGTKIMACLLPNGKAMLV